MKMKAEANSLMSYKDIAIRELKTSALVNEIVEKSIDEVMDKENREALLNFISELSEAVKKYQEEAERMTPKEAGNFIKGMINELTLDRFKAEIAKGRWHWSDKPDRAGFESYVTRNIINNMNIAIIINEHKALGRQVRKWIDSHINSIFPPEPLPKMPQRPKKHISPNDKLMHALTTHSIINGGEVNLSVLPNDGITTYVMAIYEPDKEMEPFNLSPFERTVMDAVCSIYRQAKLDGDDFPVMTPASIYKAMPGGGSYPTAAMQEKIAEVYTKMRHIFVKLDGTEHLMKLKKIKPGEKYTKETNMLLAEEHTYRRQNGTTSIGWQLFQKPVILDYAEMTGQLVNVPVKVMQIEGLKTTGEPDGLALNMNETRRELLAYLVRRVAVIKHAQESALREANYKRNRAAGKSWREFMKKSPVILFESAFEATKITATNRKTLKDCKDFCRAVLKYWKGINYIFGYQEVKQGRADRGLEILFREV